MNSRIVDTRSDQHRGSTPYRSMLQHAVVVALFFFVTTCGACVADRSPSARYRSAVFTDITVDRGLVYRSDPDLHLDLEQPAGDTAARRPAVVWVHGGGFTGGDRSSSVTPMPAELVKAGYVVASIDYRLLASAPCVAMTHPSDDCGAALDAAVRDAQAAVQWLRRNAATFRVDVDRIAIAGESAGGMTAAGVGTRAADPASSVRAWVSISGGIDGGAFVDSHDSPGLLFSGTADSYIPHQWSLDTEAAMRRAGVPVVLVTLEGANHVPVAQSDRFVQETRDFLYKELDLG